MPETQQTIDNANAIAAIIDNSKNINQLPALSTIVNLQDKVALYKSSTDETVKISVSDLPNTNILLQKVITAATYTILDADVSYTLIFDNATGVTVTLDTLATDNFKCGFLNKGVGSVTFVDGTATGIYPDGNILPTNSISYLIREGTTTEYTFINNLGRVIASQVPIADVGDLITATEVEGALQENRTLINGGMLKSIYDTDNNGIVDNAQLVNGLNVETAVPLNAVFTDTETLTTLSLATNILKYTDENGVIHNLDLSLYLDDTNLARIVSGTLNGTTGIATFTRDDASTFTVDMSALLDAITLNNTLTSISITEGLTAAQGKVLKDVQDTQQTAINLNTAKTSYTDAAAVALNTAKVGYTEALVSANTDVVANTAKTGITAQQASDITTNNDKVTDLVHPLVETAVPVNALFTDTDTVYNDTAIQAEVTLNTAKVSNVVSLGDGLVEQDITDIGNLSGINTGDQVIPVTGVDFDPAGTDNSDNNAVNTLYSGLVSDINHNVTTNLSLGTVTPTTMDVDSSDGTDATLIGATTVNAGLLSAAKYNEIEANTADRTEINVLQKWISYGESYMSNFRSTMLDLGATYFPNSGGYEMGKIKQSGVTPSLLMIPSAVSEGKLHSVLPTNRVGDFDVVRNCNASYINEDGLIANALPNVPRIDFTDGDGALLTEPQSRNLITYPVSFDNAYWRKYGTTVVGGQASPSVDYPTSAFKLVEDTSTGYHYLSLGADITITSGATVTRSLYAKKGGRSFIKIVETNISSTHAYFDLNNGTVGTVSNCTAEIKLLTNGYYRCSITKTMPSTFAFLRVYLADSDNSDSYTGDGTSGVYIYGAQLEQLSYPTSLIYNGTEGAQVTRLQDVITGAGDVNSFNSEEGTLFVEIESLITTESGSERYISISDKSTSNSIRLGFNGNTNEIYVRIFISGTGYTPIIHTSATITDFNKLAVKWKVDDFSLWVNGFEITTITTSGNIFGSGILTDLKFNRGDGGEIFYGKCKQLQVYKTALTDAELISLTS